MVVYLNVFSYTFKHIYLKNLLGRWIQLDYKIMSEVLQL